MKYLLNHAFLQYLYFRTKEIIKKLLTNIYVHYKNLTPLWQSSFNYSFQNYYGNFIKAGIFGVLILNDENSLGGCRVKIRGFSNPIPFKR